MFEKISFPEYEYGSIQNYLKKLGYCYTTRVYKELGKYKVGELYAAVARHAKSEKRKNAE